MAGVVASSAHRENIAFAIGAQRTVPLWRTLAGLTATDWADVTDLPGAQVAVAELLPGLVDEQLCCRVRRAEST